MDSGQDVPLYGIWGPSFYSVYAVGYGGTIIHYSGATWGTMTSGTTETLRGIWGLSDDDIVAVGDNGTIIHFNGSSWIAMTSGTDTDLFSVWGTSMSDIHVAGSGGLKLHYDGVEWNETPCLTGSEIPVASLELSQNYPNPFNPTTSIEFGIPADGYATIYVYDVSGRLVKSLVAGELPQGRHTVRWNGFNNSGSKVASGVYFYRISFAGEEIIKKMVLLR